MKADLYLVVDFEATCCDNGTVPRTEMEIIEIGAVMVEGTNYQPVDEFQSFVRPVRHPELTTFCTELTSIQQSDVDSAPEFHEFIRSLTAWLPKRSDFVFCSWGDYDLDQWKQDCNFHKVPDPIHALHLNVKRLITEQQGLKKRPGLGEAVRMAGLQFAGTQHRGIDDARNIARLFPYIFGQAALGSYKSIKRKRS